MVYDKLPFGWPEAVLAYATVALRGGVNIDQLHEKALSFERLGNKVMVDPEHPLDRDIYVWVKPLCRGGARFPSGTVSYR